MNYINHNKNAKKLVRYWSIYENFVSEFGNVKKGIK